MAPSVAVLIAARVLQAIGAAMVIPTSLGLLLHAFPASERAGATGAWASGGAIAAASGPPLGGLLVLISWRWVFLVNLPLAVIALIGARLVVPEVRHRETGGRPDLAGIVLLVAGVGGLVLCIVEGQTWGWGSIGFLSGLAAACALLGTFLWRCGHHPMPIVDLSLLRLRPFATANLAMLSFYIGFGATLLGVVLFLTDTWHDTTLTAGLQIAPGPLVVAVLSPQVRRLVVRVGARLVATLGSFLLAAAGCWWALRLGTHPDYAGAFLPGMLLAGLGTGLTQAALYGVVAGVLPANRFATGSGVLNMSRQVALALGVALLVAILGSTPDLRHFHVVFWLIAAAGLLATLASLGLPGRMHQAPRARPRQLKTEP